MSNFVGILSQGLRIAPPEAPVTGYMYGKGVYFADICSKSANYCHPTSDHNVCLVLVCDVALGNPNPKFAGDYEASKLPKGFDSVFGVGKTWPDEEEDLKHQGSIMPIGKLVKDETIESELEYHEYVVYNTDQSMYLLMFCSSDEIFASSRI